MIPQSITLTITPRGYSQPYVCVCVCVYIKNEQMRISKLFETFDELKSAQRLASRAG